MHDRKESSDFVVGTCVCVCVCVASFQPETSQAEMIFVRHLRRKLDECFTSLDLAPIVSCSSLVYTTRAFFLTDASLIS